MIRRRIATLKDLKPWSLAVIGLVAGSWAIAAAAQTTHIVTTVGNTFSAANITIAQGDSVMWTALQPNFRNVADLDHLAREGVLFETAVTNATDLSLPASRAFRQVR